MLNRIALAAIASACCVTANPTAGVAQVGAPELLVRIDRLENQIRQLTGQLEQIQYRNQQLEAALKRLQDDYEFGARGGPRVAPARPGIAQPMQPAAPSGRRSDAFDPAENPNAPGAPRALGSISSQPAPATFPRNDGGAPVIAGEEPPRGIGPPFDLSTGATAGVEPGSGRMPAGVPPGRRRREGQARPGLMRLQLRRRRRRRGMSSISAPGTCSARTTRSPRTRSANF